MTGGSKIVGLWRDAEPLADDTAGTDEELLLEEAAPDLEAEFGDYSAAPSRAFPFMGMILGLAAIGWLVFNGWLLFSRPLPTIESIPGLFATVAIPLILLGTGWLLILRNSQAESRRFADTARQLRYESELLELRLGRIGSQLVAARQAMQDQAALLESYGASASANMEASARLLAEQAANVSSSATIAQRTGTALAEQFRTLIQTMPALEERAASMTAQLTDGGHALSERIDALESRLHSIAELSDDARSRTLAATKSLSGQLGQLQGATRATSDEINGMAELAANRVDIALERARMLMVETGSGLEAQAGALGTLIAQSHGAIDAIGRETIANFSEHSDEIETRLHELNRLIEGQNNLAAGLGTDLGDTLDSLEARFTVFEKDGLARSEKLAGALASLASEAERMDRTLASGNMQAEQLIGHSETLLMALDSSVREMDETYPIALSRMDDKVEHTRLLLATARPEIEALEAVADAILGRTQEAEELLRGQGRRLTEWLESTEGGLGANREQVEALQAALRIAEDNATRLTESAGPQLIAALLRVKDTADQAADRARQALGRAIPEAAKALGEASEAAMEQAIGDRVKSQIAEVADVAEQAVKAAHQASDRLMRQLLTIADTSANIEQRIQDAEHAAEDRDRDNFARRSALLIESLNSTAIDITKVLSSDVTDSTWAAYLKGDRGVFTRRAVKLLDAGEAREISLHYDNDVEFRDHVNRYIHDFESILRTILSTRDGSALGVTILSSDMGKLYVALAQAIERLRH